MGFLLFGFDDTLSSLDELDCLAPLATKFTHFEVISRFSYAACELEWAKTKRARVCQKAKMKKQSHVSGTCGGQKGRNDGRSRRRVCRSSWLCFMITLLP